MPHTIFLVQPDNNKNSRTWIATEGADAAVVALVNIFEAKLRELNPTLSQITYELADISHWIDKMPDLSALEFSPAIQAYLPNGKDWIKQKVEQHFLRQAARAAGARAGDRQPRR